MFQSSYFSGSFVGIEANLAVPVFFQPGEERHRRNGKREGEGGRGQGREERRRRRQRRREEGRGDGGELRLLLASAGSWLKQVSRSTQV